MFKHKKALLLDMNSTFMFGEDRFSNTEDFSIKYKELGGTLSNIALHEIIMNAYNYLNVRYPDKKFHHAFPSVKDALLNTLEQELSEIEIQRILDTFAHHELGTISSDYIDVLFELKNRFTLAVVIDIWSEKKYWLDTFHDAGIFELFSGASFSSDHGMVKPSPKPFELVLTQLELNKEDCLVIGDSVRRDLGGATAAGIDCVLVGGANDPKAKDSYGDLFEFNQSLSNSY